MAEKAFLIISPGNRRSAQLLEDQALIREILPILTARLDLPERLNYRLIPGATGKPLRLEDTLAKAQLSAGAELILQPVRDTLFNKLLQFLYDEAKSYLKGKAIDMAEEKMKEILRLDPEFPDPEGLRTLLKIQPPEGALKPAIEAGKGLADAASAKEKGTAAKDALEAKEKGPAVKDAIAAREKGAAVKDALAPKEKAATLKEIAAAKGKPAGTKGSSMAQKEITAAKEIPSRLGTPKQPKVKPAKGPGGLSRGCLIAGAVGGGGIVVVGGAIATFYLVTRVLLPNLGGPVLGTGDVQVTLRWNTAADLDLHVIDPYGEEIYFQNDTSESGGYLDVDANSDCSTQSYSPVENIFWPTGGAPYGTYQVSVVNYKYCGVSGSTDYEVTIRVGGRTIGTYPGTMQASDSSQFITSFTR
jgi:hypothetical protein